MAATQPSVSIDDRDRASKLSRRQALDILSERNIPVPDENIPLGTGVPDNYRGPTLLKIMDSAGINPNDPFPELNWETVHGKDERGNVTSFQRPVRDAHQSMGKNIDYDAVIAEKAAAAEEHAEQQGVMINDLVARLEALEKNTVPLDRLGPPQLKRVCKERGIDTKDLKTKADLLAALGD